MHDNPYTAEGEEAEILRGSFGARLRTFLLDGAITVIVATSMLAWLVIAFVVVGLLAMYWTGID